MNKNLANAEVADLSSAAEKVPRGYTPHGYPAVWLKTMNHEECVGLMNAQIAAGNGRKFAVKKPATEKEVSKFGRGYSKDGYPIQWLRSHSHAECMEFLTQGIKPPKTSTHRVKTADTGQTVRVSKKAMGATAFTVAGHTFYVSSDKHCYTLNFDGRTTYYGMFSELLSAVRQALLRRKLSETTKGELLTLEKMIAAEKSVTAAVLAWEPSSGFNSSLG